MKGFILRYNDNLTPREIIDINNILFGRIVKIYRNGKYHYYYYRGLFHNIAFFKLSNGCYFTQYINNIPNNINILSANINIKKRELKTAKEYFKEKYTGKKVNNLE